jgi:hypothetical protein
MYAKATEIVDERLRALQDGDEVLRSNVAEGKDIMSVLCKGGSFTSWSLTPSMTSNSKGKCNCT